MTIRSHDQFKHHDLRPQRSLSRRLNGRRVVFMNEDERQRCRPATGTDRDLTSHFNARNAWRGHFMVAPFPIARGCTATTFRRHRADSINSSADRSKHAGKQKRGHFRSSHPQMRRKSQASFSDCEDFEDCTVVGVLKIFWESAMACPEGFEPPLLTRVLG